MRAPSARAGRWSSTVTVCPALSAAAFTCTRGRSWGDWALRRFGIEPDALDPAERRRMLRLARLEYAARMAGSLHAELSPRRAR